jgi:hypothetical protein
VARISIDDELHADFRFKRLCRNVGEDLAVGLIYRFWRLAQDYWGDEMSLVPFAEFEAEGFGPLLQVGLAENRPEGVYACGGNKRFAWYLQLCRASRAGVEAKRARRQVKPFAEQPELPPAQPEQAHDEPETCHRLTGSTTPVNPSHLFSPHLSDTVEEEAAAAAAAGSCAWAHPHIGEFLAQVPMKAQLSWVNKCGMDAIFVEGELHKAISHWECDEETQRRYTDKVTGQPQIALYVNRWLTRAWGRRPAEAPPPAEPSPKAPAANYPPPGSALKAIDSFAEEVRANPADPDRVRKLVDQITGRSSASGGLA